MAGKVWKDKEHPQGSIKGLTPDQRFLIKKANINVNIVLEVTNNKFKYDLFQRLNIRGIHPTSED